MWAKMLAARLEYRLKRRGRPVVEHQHIGNLVKGIVDAGIPHDVTVDEVLGAVDAWAREAPSTKIRDPLKWFLYQVRSVVPRIWQRRDAIERERRHVHAFRAILSDTTLGCLTCPETRPCSMTT